MRLYNGSVGKDDCNHVLPFNRLKTASLVQDVYQDKSHMKEQSPSIFINYRWNDNPGYASLIANKFAETFGEDDVYFDVFDKKIGTDITQEIERKIINCKIFLAIIGENWLDLDNNSRSRLFDKNDLVRLEIETAIQNNIIMIPVVIGNAIVFISIAIIIYIFSDSQGNINGIGLIFGIAPSVIVITICYAHLPGITGVLKDITAPNKRN